MKNRSIGLLALAAMVSVAAADLAAQNARHRPESGMQRPGVERRGPQAERHGTRPQGVEALMRMREQLELSEDQLGQLDALRRTSVERRSAHMAEMAELRSQLEAGQIQRSQVMVAMEARGEAARAQADEYRARIESILTESQRGTLEEMRQQGRAFRAGMAVGARRGGEGIGRQRAGRGEMRMNGRHGMRGGMEMRGPPRPPRGGGDGEAIGPA